MKPFIISIPIQLPRSKMALELQKFRSSRLSNRRKVRGKERQNEKYKLRQDDK